MGQFSGDRKNLYKPTTFGTRVGGGGGMIAGIAVRVAGGVVRCCRRAVKWSLRRGPHRWGLIDGVLSAGVRDCGDAVDVEMRR